MNLNCIHIQHKILSCRPYATHWLFFPLTLSLESCFKTLILNCFKYPVGIFIEESNETRAGHTLLSATADIIVEVSSCGKKLRSSSLIYY